VYIFAYLGVYLGIYEVLKEKKIETMITKRKVCKKNGEI
jgi:hypothetical protein